MTDETAKLATSRCIFGHRWTMWEQGVNQSDGKPIAVQSRCCVRCGRVQLEVHRA